MTYDLTKFDLGDTTVFNQTRTTAGAVPQQRA
jgi:hypothetical protein